ncbi:baseplate J/gp47 family protein [Natronorubrum bangense]|uniref:Baseplate J family protein n=2 Tax=Natronorubrum bangense TaxID=61858 RepID=L9WL02_9EURY|nr:baseplate J/gp47 family protein [Natronorubrum bangense]ELY49906.1 baseplate J family protein [Natronorubrum bangense JCM 10635]QCC55523.1 baseplate J family protein [Natronorubrum bangense]
MTIIDGQFQSDSANDILDALLEDAKDYFGDDLNDEQLAVIRLFYQPIANRLAETQDDIGLVLSSAQLEYAEGMALDLLTALIGVRRREALKATGEATFSRNSVGGVDYTIPSGTVLQTDEIDPVRFETTETAVLPAGDLEVTVSIRATEGGAHGNVGANSLTVMPSPPTGIDAVTNSQTTDGGREEELDEDLRNRAKKDLAEGSAATAPALLTAIGSVPNVRSVSIFINDSGVDLTAAGGLPDHSFELVVEGGDEQEIGQMIIDKKGAADTAYGGANGTLVQVEGELPNGQTHEVMFSRPNVVQVYVDIELEVDDEYEGDEAVRDSVVSYIGGLASSGNPVEGGLGVGDDVLIGRVQTAIYNVRGVHDVTSLTVGTTDPPTGTSNVEIAFNERATSDALDGSISITRSEA